MKIFVIGHSVFESTYKDGYIPLLVGAVRKNRDIRQEVLCDDTGEHISEYNDSYCELTGLYWIWKNVQEPIVGLVHYRRFFLSVKHGIRFHDNLYFLKPRRFENCHIITVKEAEDELARHDLIIKMSHKYHWSLRKKLLDNIPEECLKNLEYVMKEHGEEEYQAFLDYLNRHSQLLFNMFIGKKEIIDRYCEWLFPVLSEVDRRHLGTTGDRYHNREIGYLGEVLFCFWIMSKGISYVKYDTIMPRNSEITEIDHVTFSSGTNVFPIGRLFKHILRLIIR